MRVHVDPARHVRGRLTTPGDKSRSHRAVLLAALADGASRIAGASRGDDAAATLAIVQSLGARVEVTGEVLEVTGPSDGLAASGGELDCGNSGTTMRLLCGVLASVPGTHHLSGDASLSARPMDRVARPLSLMGVAVSGQGARVTPPLTVTATGRTTGVTYDVPEPSAQVKSAVLLAGLVADAPTTVHERVRTRTATEEMLAEAGVRVTVTHDDAGRTVVVHPGRPLPRTWQIPGDPSQASFLLVGAVLHPDGEVTVTDLDAGPERWGYLGVLERMGARVTRVTHDGRLDVSTRASDLVATDVEGSEIPSLDEVPILAVAAAAATGTTRFIGIGELRVKESDRLAGTVALVRGLGATATVEGDTLAITGVGTATRFTPLHAAGREDHRMVMAAAVAGAVGAGADIDGADTVASSYPDFFEVLGRVSS